MHTLLVDTRYFIKLCTFTVHNEYQEYILSKWRQQTWMCFNSSFNGLQVSFSVPYFASIKHFKICIYSYLYLIIIFEAYPSNLTLSGLNKSVARTVTRKQSRRNARILVVCSQIPSLLRWTPGQHSAASGITCWNKITSCRFSRGSDWRVNTQRDNKIRRLLNLTPCVIIGFGGLSTLSPIRGHCQWVRVFCFRSEGNKAMAGKGCVCW